MGLLVVLTETERKDQWESNSCESEAAEEIANHVEKKATENNEKTIFTCEFCLRSVKITFNKFSSSHSC